jgi:hypothetical protein
MQILRQTDTGAIQSNALARKLRVKIMQRIAIIEIPPGANNEIETDIAIDETVEEIIDFLLSALSDKVPLPWNLTHTRIQS